MLTWVGAQVQASLLQVITYMGRRVPSHCKSETRTRKIAVLCPERRQADERKPNAIHTEPAIIRWWLYGGITYIVSTLNEGLHTTYLLSPSRVAV